MTDSPSTPTSGTTGTATGPVAHACLRRRTVLQGVGVVGGVVVGGSLLAACGGDETGSDRASEAPASSADATDGTGATSGGSGKELGPTSDVPVGSGRYYEAEKVIVTQPSEGEFKAFSSVCTHQGCAVSMIEDDLMVCPCHNSQFSVEDGSVESGPATEPLPEKTVTVDGDTLFVA